MEQNRFFFENHDEAFDKTLENLRPNVAAQNALGHPNFGLQNNVQNVISPAVNAVQKKYQFRQPETLKNVQNSSIKDDKQENVEGVQNSVNVSKTPSTTKNNKEIAKFITFDEKRIFLVGNIEKLLKWHRNMPRDYSCIYAVIAPIVFLQEGTIKLQKIMLLREKTGPILQVHYYLNTHINIEDFHVGQHLRCTGRMTGHNILTAITIRAADSDEIASLHRMSAVSDHSMSKIAPGYYF